MKIKITCAICKAEIKDLDPNYPLADGCPICGEGKDCYWYEIWEEV